MRGRVLVVAGSDSGGGAGIQGDIKSIAAMGGYAMTAITALTAQDTLGVHAVHAIPPEFVALQIERVLADIGADAIKTGMLGDAATIEAVAGSLQRGAPGVPLVVDPVMVAKGGAALLMGEAVAHLRFRLLPLAAVVTPNAPEAEALTGVAVHDATAMRRAADALLAAGARAVLLKGGHVDGAVIDDLLATAAGAVWFRAPRIATRHTHGTGCALASALAAGLAQGMALEAAAARAIAYVRAAIAAAPGLGHGHGPLNHSVVVPPPAISQPASWPDPTAG